MGEGGHDPGTGVHPEARVAASARVHPTAVVDAGAVLGEGVRVWHFVHVGAGARIGAGSVLGQNVFVAPGVEVGAGCRLQNNVSVYEGVTLEDDVFVGPSAVFTNVSNPRAHVRRRHAFEPTRVRRRATLGANCTIRCGVTLGEASFVGAGAVVLADVPARVQVVGNPARAAGHRCDCGEGLGGDTTDDGGDGALRRVACATCGAAYTGRADGGLDRHDPE